MLTYLLERKMTIRARSPTRHSHPRTRAQARPNSYGGMLLAEIERLQAAIQAHHDGKYGGIHDVVSPADLALYEAAGIDHRVLAWQEGGNYEPLGLTTESMCEPCSAIAEDRS